MPSISSSSSKICTPGRPRGSVSKVFNGTPLKVFGSQRGFSLLEMIVSIGVFFTALVIILGALISINDAARKARSMRIVSENLNAAIDSMSRNIRMGGNFHCGCGAGGNPPTPGDNSFPLGLRDCVMTDNEGGGGDACLAFEGQRGNPDNPNDQIIYKLSGGSIQRSLDSGATYLPLTAPELHISNFQFYVHGTKANDDQPVITMVIRGSALTTARTTTNFDVQTSVSAYSPNLNLTP